MALPVLSKPSRIRALVSVELGWFANRIARPGRDALAESPTEPARMRPLTTARRRSTCRRRVRSGDAVAMNLLLLPPWPTGVNVVRPQHRACGGPAWIVAGIVAYA